MDGKTQSGRVIKRNRTRRGMAQHDLALKSGLTAMAISYAENGVNILEDGNIRAVAAALDVNVGALLELAAIDRGRLSIGDKPLRLQKLVCRITHGELSDSAVAKLAAIVEQEREPVAA